MIKYDKILKILKIDSVHNCINYIKIDILITIGFLLVLKL